MNWTSVDERLPENDGYYLVACRGGNVAISFYISDRSQAKSYFSGGGYSRKQQGKASGHFGLSHEYGYQIEYWMNVPKHPGTGAGQPS